MNEVILKIDTKIYRLTNMNNGNKYDRATKDAGINASPKQILAHYDKHAGYIQDKNGNKIINGQFWEKEKQRVVNERKNLKYKTDEELKEIMRNSIDNSYAPTSIYHKAKQELEFRNIPKIENKREEIIKLSPEFYGMGINLKSLWKIIISWF